MNPRPHTDPREVKRIFDAAADIPPPQRAAYLAQACANNAPLRSQVESLLDALDSAPDFLTAPTHGGKPSSVLETMMGSSRAPLAAGLSESPGARIGPYKLLQLIGEGGFGAVFLAEQERPVYRKVALKLIKLGMDTRQVVARFEQERQALAMMDHPHIAKVLDAGATETGRPYFVMELCTGEPITDYCDKHRVAIPERLSLFMQVCQAVQHAHQKGIIHRDIKPSNILVSTQDGRPHARVIDFGIAKATASRLTEKTLFTEHRQLIGTPEYMSPEQAEASPDIDTRTDVYSLGVLLYELLTGTTPFDPRQLRSAAYGEVQRIIREVEPPIPSTRLSKKTAGLADVAALRQTEPRRLGTIIRGDLDWIVMKSLEKDRQRRYESAGALGRDVERHLAGEAVLAAPPSAAYRLRKFLRRHRGPAIASGAIALAVLLGLVASTAGFVMASRARNRAEVARAAEGRARITADEQRDRADRQSEQLRQELYISQIARAQHLIETGSNEPITPLLARCDAELRGWEWERLRWLADRSDRTLRAHQTTNWFYGSGVVYTRDGRRFMTFGDSSLVRIWDSESFRLLLELNEPDKAEVLAAAFSPDGSRAVIGTGASTVRVFDAATGQLLASRSCGGSAVRSVAMGPDDALIAAGTWIGPTLLWNMRSSEPAREFGGNMARGEALHFSNDGSRLLIGSLGNDVSLVDVASGRPILSERGAGFVVLDAALSHDGRKMATVGQDGRLWVREAPSGKLLYSVAAGKGGIFAVAFDHNDDYLAVGGDEGIAFFDASNGERLGSLLGHDATVIGLAFHPQGRYLLSIDANGVVKRWHLGVRQSVATYAATMLLNSVAFSADGSEIYLGTTDDGLRVLDARTMENLNPGPQPIVFVDRIQVSPDGSTLATSGLTNKWGLPDGKPITVLFDRQGRNPRSWPSYGAAISISPDSKWVADLEAPGRLVIHDLASGSVVKQVECPGAATWCWGATEAQVVIGLPDGTVRSIETQSGKVLSEFRAHNRALNVLMLDVKNGLLVTGGTADNVLKVWEWPSGKLRHELTDAGGPIAAAISPDGRRLIAGGAAMHLPLWDLQTGRRLFSVGQHSSHILSVAYSPDGRTVASCGGDHTLRVWETRSPSERELDARLARDTERFARRRSLYLELDRTQSNPQ